MKTLQASDLTEIWSSWVVHFEPNKKLVLCINLVHGVPYQKWEVYHGDKCLLATTNLTIALERYNLIGEADAPIQCVPEEHLVDVDSQS